MGSARRPPELKETENKDEDRKERIYQRWEKIRDFDLDVRKTAAMISKMCTDTVQKEFLAVKTSTEWDPKELLDWLKRRYTLQNFASKWSALDKLLGIRHSECKNVSEYMSHIIDASAEIDDLKISISEAVVIHALNNLDSHFRPYLAIPSHDAPKKGKLPTLSELTKTLEDEEMRLSNEIKGTANFARSCKFKPKPSDQENRRGTEKDSQPNSDKKKQENKECQTCGRKHRGDCWHLRAECFLCHNVGHIASKCLEKSTNTSTSSSSQPPMSQSRNITSVTKKIPCHPESKTTIGRILASCSVTPRPNITSVTSVIIYSGATDHFFCNRDLFSTYTEYQHEFETGTGQRIIAHGYGNVILRMCDMSGNVNTLTVTNESWASELGHNLLSTIPLAKKGFKVFLRKLGRPSELYFEGEVLGLADIIENQYVVRLTEDPKSATVNMAVLSSIETWHTRLTHLSYKAIVQLASIALGIQLKGPVPEEICGRCMVGKQQRKPSREPMTQATKFLELLHSDLGQPLPSTQYGYIFYISLYDDATGTYYVKPLRHKSQTFDEFLKFVT